VEPHPEAIDRYLEVDLTAGRGQRQHQDRLTFCSIQYTSVEKIAKAAQSLGAGTLMATLDLQAAYRLVPVRGAWWR